MCIFNAPYVEEVSETYLQPSKQKFDNLNDQLKCGNGLLDESLRGKEFDIVIGNPPYRLFELFIKKSFDLAKTGSTFSLLIPDTEFFLDSYSNSRKLFFPCLLSVTSWGNRCFTDVSVSVASFVCQKGSRTQEVLVVRNSGDLDSREIFVRNTPDVRIFFGLTRDWLGFEQKIKTWQVLGSVVEINRGEECSKESLSRTNEEQYLPCVVANNINSDCYEENFQPSYSYFIHEDKVRKKQLHHGIRIISQRIRNPSLKRRIVAQLINNSQVALANVAVTRSQSEDVIYLVLAIYNSKLMNYYFSKKYVDVNVNEGKLKNIPLPDLNTKRNAIILKAVIKLAKENRSGIFNNLEINNLIFNLYEISEIMQKEVIDFYSIP